MITMLDVEIRRYLSRPLVRGLVAIAVVGCAFAGVIARREAGPAGTSGEFHLVDLWLHGEDPIIGIGAMLLVIGAVLGGASMIGAEWRAGTFVTLLTWEPNRRRVVAAKVIACGLVAFVIAVVLLALFCIAFLPTALGPGTTEGADAAWLWTLIGACLRIAALTGLAAMLMASIAMLGRNTAAALGVAFGYLMVVENIVHAWKPWAARFLLGPNGAIFVTGADLETEQFTRGTLTAGLTLAAYVAAIAVIATVSFSRRDVVAST